MTSNQSTDLSPAAEPSATEPAITAAAHSAGVSGFTSLFSAAATAAGKRNGQAWHQQGNKSAHEKKIGPAPNGTRRSMGKR
nr:hypothetical protein [uncultured Pseudomonas sp.]